MNKPKFCKDCTFYRESIITPSFSTCRHPKALYEYNLVTGLPKFYECINMRHNDCGPDAKLFMTDGEVL